MGVNPMNRAPVRQIPAEPGTYALVLSSSVQRRIRIGQLGTMQLQPGYYIYVGSALGPGGLRARIARHLRLHKRTHWHIDYLRARARVDEVWYWCGVSCREHQLARALETAPGASVPLPGFGASDCGCTSHLYFFKRRPRPRRLGMGRHTVAFRLKRLTLPATLAPHYSGLRCQPLPAAAHPANRWAS
jgi:Uri superfamily endonuclease